MKKSSFLAIFVFIPLVLFGQRKALDKIAAVVDNEIILQSEVDFRTSVVASQQKLNADDAKLKERVLKSLIDEKLIFAQALIDSVSVTDDEIDRHLDYQVRVFIQQYGSVEKVESAYGMSMDKIKKELREEVRKSVLVQKVQEKKFGQTEASKREVVEFFEKFKDSLGVIPEKVKVAHIFKNPKATSVLKKKAQDFAGSLLDSIKAGVDFAKLAKKYSDDPGSAKDGGDLGFVKRGVFYPEFESVAYSLVPSTTSGVIESPAGYHIIQLLEKRGEAIHSRHILIKVKADDNTELETISFLSDIRDSLMRKYNTFGYYAKKYSEDKETANLGGVLGKFYVDQMDKDILTIVSKLKEGEVSAPVRLNISNTDYGYHIVKVESRILQHLPNLDIDYDEMLVLAAKYKRQNLLEEWVTKLKKNIYWEIKG